MLKVKCSGTEETVRPLPSLVCERHRCHFDALSDFSVFVMFLIGYGAVTGFNVGDEKPPHY
jgi:hypothetical protein